jgi:hypothetical protein
MARKREDPTQTTDKDIKPADGPPEIEDAARQEVEYPADETDEG